MNEYLTPINSESDLEIYEKFLEETNSDKKYKIHCFINNRTSVISGNSLKIENNFVKITSNNKVLFINADRVKYIEEV